MIFGVNIESKKKMPFTGKSFFINNSIKFDAKLAESWQPNGYISYTIGQSDFQSLDCWLTYTKSFIFQSFNFKN